MSDFRLFEVCEEYIVAKTKEEAIADHMSRIDDDYGEDGPDISEVSLDAKGMFETESGYKEMTFREYLGEDFEYDGPQLICWEE